MGFFKDFTSKKRIIEANEDLRLINEHLQDDIKYHIRHIYKLETEKRVCEQKYDKLSGDYKALHKESNDLWEENGKLICKIADLQEQKDGLIEQCKRLRAINREYEKQYTETVNKFVQREYDLLGEIAELNKSVNNAAKTIQQRKDIATELRIKLARLSAIVEERKLVSESNQV